MRRPLRSDAARAVSRLAMDFGEPAQMARARRIFRSNPVTDVEITPGAVSGSVFLGDGFAEHVVVTVEEGDQTEDGLPSPESISTKCTCEAESGCEHSLALLLAFAEEVEGNGRVLATWVGGSRHAGSDDEYVEKDPFFASPVKADEVERPTLGQYAFPKFSEDFVVAEVDAFEVLAEASRTASTQLR